MEKECPYNPGVVCYPLMKLIGACKTCGWNPEVERERKEKIEAEGPLALVRLI